MVFSSLFQNVRAAHVTSPMTSALAGQVRGQQEGSAYTPKPYFLRLAAFRPVAAASRC